MDEENGVRQLLKYLNVRQNIAASRPQPLTFLDHAMRENSMERGFVQKKPGQVNSPRMRRQVTTGRKFEDSGILSTCHSTYAA